MATKLLETCVHCLRNKNSGFTIIELVIVIAIIGVAAQAVVVNVGEIEEKTSLNNAAHTAIADLRLAQESAMNFNREVNFVVDVGNNRYYAVYTDDNSYVKNATLNDIDVTFTDDEFRGVDITHSDSGGSLTFGPNGRPDDGGGFFTSLEVLELNNGDMTISVLRSGLTTLEDVNQAGGCGC